MKDNTCPICGERIESSQMEFLDNGNPACPRCVQNEREKSTVNKETEE